MGLDKTTIDPEKENRCPRNKKGTLRMGYDKERSEQIYRLYFYGHNTYQSIGRLYGITRQAVENLIVRMSSEARRSAMRHQKRVNRAIAARVWREGALKKRYGDGWRAIYTEIRRKSADFKAGLRWSVNYDACIDCGTTEKAHLVHGMCAACASRNRYKNPKYRAKHKKRCIMWRERLKNKPAEYNRYIKKQRIHQNNYWDRRLRNPIEYELYILRNRMRYNIVKNCHEFAEELKQSHGY